MTVKNTFDCIPLWLMAQPQHIVSLLSAKQPYLLINKHDNGDIVSSIAPTDELSRVVFNPQVIRNFCNHDTMAIVVKKSHRNLSNLIVLGRSNDSDVVITRREVSKSHCGFYEVNGEWYVVDLDSTNGIIVDDDKIAKNTLYSGPRTAPPINNVNDINSKKGKYVNKVANATPNAVKIASIAILTVGLTCVNSSKT